MQRKFKKTVSFILCILMCMSSFCANAQNTEDYTITKLNDYVSMYHITSEAQANKGLKGGEGAQLVFSMDMSHQNSNNILLSNDTVGIYRSQDGGKLWEVSSEGLEWTMVNTVRYDVDDDSIAYAAVATPSNSSLRVNRYKNTGFYKSYDGGKSWTQKLALCSEKSYTTLIASGNKNADGSRNIYTAAQNAQDFEGPSQGCTGVWKSVDKGETFTCTGLLDRSVNAIYSDLEISLTIVASDKGIDVSFDNGESWIQKNTGLTTTEATAVAVNPLNKDHWIIGIKNNGIQMWQTLNAGDDWTKINMSKAFGGEQSSISHLEFAVIEGLNNPRLFVNGSRCHEPNRYSDDFGVTLTVPVYDLSSYGLLDSYGGYYPTQFCINPNNTKEVFTSKITPYKSYDGGESFSFSGSGYSGFLGSDWHFDQNGAVKYMSFADLGFVKMKESENTLFPYTEKIIFQGPSDTTVTVDGEEKTVSWAKSSTSVTIDPNNSNHGFVTMGGYIYSTPATIMETNDGFENFTEFPQINEKIVSQGKNLSFVQYNPDNDNMIYTDYFVSYDNGQSWQEAEHPISAISNKNGNTVYSLDNYKIYKSDDCGASWVDTGLSLPENTGGRYNVFISDLFYEDVMWAGAYADIYRIDIPNNRVQKVTSFKGRFSTSLEIMDMAQNPMLKNHIIITARDYNAGGFYVYETYDYGKTFSHITEIPYYAGSGEIEFHPSEKLVFFGTPMGTLVYLWEGRVYTVEKRLKTAYYNKKANTFEISGNAGNNNTASPVTLTLENEEGKTQFVYFDYTNEYGDFEFVCKNIPDFSGAYTARVSMVDDEDMFTYKFNTGTETDNKEAPTAIYDSVSKNLVIYGEADDKEGTQIPIVLKKKNADMKSIDELNISDNIAYMGEAYVLADKTFVHKFKFDTKNESIFDYDISAYADGNFFESIDVQVIQNGALSVNLSIKDDSGQSLVIADDKDFTAAADIRYFFEDKLELSLIVACYEGDKLIDAFIAEKDFDYFSEEFSLSGRIKEKTDRIKLMLWSDFEALKPHSEMERIKDDTVQ